jgi:hypothetical protein
MNGLGMIASRMQALQERAEKAEAEADRARSDAFLEAAESLDATAGERGCLDEFPCWCDKADQFRDMASRPVRP